VLIQPVQPVFVVVKIGHEDHICQLVSLSDNQLELKCNDYFEKECEVSFLGKYFRGRAIINEVTFSKLYFIYQLNIEEIQFQPGLLINTRL
jgi:hypothetical protein